MPSCDGGTAKPVMAGPSMPLCAFRCSRCRLAAVLMQLSLCGCAIECGKGGFANLSGLTIDRRRAREEASDQRMTQLPGAQRKGAPRRALKREGPAERAGPNRPKPAERYE